MDKHFKSYWKNLRSIIYAEIVLSITIQSLSVVLITMMILRLLNQPYIVDFLLVMAFLSVVIFSTFAPIGLFSKTELIKTINSEYPYLQYSFQLFFKQQLNRIEALQMDHIAKKLPTARDLIGHVNWRVNMLFMISALLCYFTLYKLPEPTFQTVSPTVDPTISVKSTQSLHHVDSFIRGDLNISIIPPAYTKLKAYELTERTREIEVGSTIKFFNDQHNAQSFLIWNARDTLPFRTKGKSANLTKSNIQRAFSYQLLYKMVDSIFTEDLRVVDIKPDEKPLIEVSLQGNRFIRNWDDLKDFDLSISIRDDYGLSETNLIATLSKGEGEAVKFRELKFPINALTRGTKFQSVNYALVIDTLDMAPGDELYFFIEAFDNKWPEPQRAKSDVYFITLNDTTTKETSNYGGLALSSELEYFKSQRQIIIDTEKLISQSSKMQSEAFKRKSNLIGDDQKILRLRYGVFLGEEFETTGGLGEIDHSGHDHGPVAGQDEHEEEHETHDHAGHDHSGHNHGTQAASESNFSNDIYNSEEMAAYVHAHDDAEIATFFDAKTKRLLKEALANMWEAELYLRTYKPKKALPYEHKALKIIKEVQQASRIYVERIGFEPPPLTPKEKRLSGDLSEIDPSKANKIARAYSTFEKNLLEKYSLLNSKPQLEADKTLQLINEIGTLLAGEISNNPLVYGKILAMMARYKQQPCTAILEEINMALSQILPENKQAGQQVEQIQLELTDIFRQTDLN